MVRCAALWWSGVPRCWYTGTDVEWEATPRFDLVDITTEDGDGDGRVRRTGVLRRRGRTQHMRDGKQAEAESFFERRAGGGAVFLGCFVQMWTLRLGSPSFVSSTLMPSSEPSHFQFQSLNSSSLTCVPASWLDASRVGRERASDEGWQSEKRKRGKGKSPDSAAGAVYMCAAPCE